LIKRDQELVIRFLDEYNRVNQDSFKVIEWPEQTERNRPAVEAIAINQAGTSLAIEHTLLQPFVGEKDDTQRFRAIVDSIEKDLSVRLPGFMVSAFMQVGSVPKGVNWSEAGIVIREWLRANIEIFPMQNSSHTVPGLPFELRIDIHKTDLRDDAGKLFFSRYLPEDSFSDVMLKALSTKLPKLVATEADRHILVLEQDSLNQGYGDVCNCLKSVGSLFSELDEVDEVWLIHSVAWGSENYLSFARVWPDLAFANVVKVEQ